MKAWRWVRDRVSLRTGAYLLFVAMGVVGMWRVETTAHQAKQAAADTRQTRAEVLCPLYEVFLQTDTPQRRAATPPADRPRYDHAIAVVRAGAATLACTFLDAKD